MPERVITDTSCLIVLHNIGELELLHKLYNTVTITPEVAKEFGEPLPKWFNLSSPANISLKDMLEEYIDAGEASVLALAVELPGSVAIIWDDIKARKIAIA